MDSSIFGRQQTDGRPAGRPRQARYSVYGRQAIAGRLNVLFIAIVLTGTLFQLFAMPLMMDRFGIEAAWLLVPIMLLQPPHWGLIHEAIHSRLLPNARADKAFARILSVAIGVPFEVTRFSHLVHHRFSRHGYDRTDVYDGQGSYMLAWLRYWGRLFGGVYLGILTSPLIACMPKRMSVRLMERAIPIKEEGDLQVRRLFTSIAMNPAKRRGMRHDFALTLALYGTSAWAYGRWWPMLVASMYVRGLWHSFADNVAHHGVELDEPERARNYTLSKLWRVILMNQNLHLTHHLHPNAPWTLLETISVPEGRCRNDNYFRAALRQVDLAYPLVVRPDPHASATLMPVP